MAPHNQPGNIKEARVKTASIYFRDWSWVLYMKP